MSKATIVYISMFILLGAGLSLVLAIGHGLTAPPDVSGYWTVTTRDADAPLLGDGLELEQSGKYLRLRTAENLRADLKLISKPDPVAGESTLRFEGGGMTLAVSGLPKRNRANFRITGPIDVSFKARRTLYEGKTLANAFLSTAQPAPTTRPLSLAPTDAIDAPER